MRPVRRGAVHPAPGAVTASRFAQAPMGAVCAVVAGGLVMAGLGSWRAGAVVLALGLLLGGGLRLALPARAAGLLAVRSRALDAALLLVLGTGLLLLARSIPAPG